MSVGSGRVYHANINCSALDRSLALYRDLLGLVPVAYTAPDATQDGAAFGLNAAQWEAWILGSADASGGSGAVVDLLQWKVPPPIRFEDGVSGAGATGFSAAVFGQRDLADSRRRLEAAGMTLSSADVRTGPPADAVELRDPDGTTLLLVEADRDGLTGLVVGCSDPAASLPFYRNVLGFTVEDAAGPVLVDGGGLRLHLRAVGGRARAGRRPANALGIFRVALLTTDIAADYAELRSAGVDCWSPPAHLDMGSGLGGLKAMLFADPDGAAWELIEPGPRQAEGPDAGDSGDGYRLAGNDRA